MPARKGQPNGRCGLCNHAERARIDLLLAGGATFNAIGRKFGFLPDAVRRHSMNHISAERRAQLVAGPVKLSQLAEKAAEENMSLLDYLGITRSTLVNALLTASEAGDNQSIGILSGRLIECLRVLGGITGDIQRTTTAVTNNVAILTSPVMSDLQSMLIRELAPYPPARAAVLRGLEELSRRVAPGSPLMIEGGAAHA